jgi:sarcosine oxidase, subunit beta
VSAVPPTADVVVCGAGIAGLAAAHALAVEHGLRVLVVSEHAPMSLTSDKSTEAYRNWWPGPDDAMVRFMNRSIDILEGWAERTGNRFLLNRRGYVYATARASRAAEFAASAELASKQGAGPLRVYRSPADTTTYQHSAMQGWRNHPTGADLFVGEDAVRAQFPWLSPDICAVLHARRCGWFSGQQLGMMLLEELRAAGGVLIEGRVERVRAEGGRVVGVDLALGGESRSVDCAAFVNAAGPYARAVGALCGQDLPLFSEAHYKLAMEDEHGVVDRGTGLVILDDPIALPWSSDERAELAADPELAWMTQALPAGIHLRPEGYGASRTVLMLWDYHGAQHYDAPQYPLPEDPHYPELVLRGMCALAPGLRAYAERLPRVYVDGGYYTKTRENRPLIGPAGAQGAYVCAAFSGFGLMAAPAAGEMLAAQLMGSACENYGGAFGVGRYGDPAYVERLESWGETGQL